MGLKGQWDRFAEAHLSAPALFTHHLRSERRASQELSCSQNAAAPHIGGGDVEGSFGGAPPRTHPPPIHHALFRQDLQTKP